MRYRCATLVAACVVAFAAAQTVAWPAHAEHARAATQIALEKFVSWDAQQDGTPRTYRAGGIALTFTAVPEPGKPTDADLDVTAPDGRTISVPFQAGLDHAAANFAIGSLDPSNPTAQVILSTYTGGAHCCTERSVVELLKTGWKVLDLPAGYEQDVDTFPKDENGDGARAFVLSDDRFAYAFAAFAGSWMPPRIFVVRQGALVELSGSRRYDKLYLADMARAKAACIDANGFPNGGCAGFVADAARAGTFPSAWRFMLAHYARDDKWDLPEGCKTTVARCPKGSEIVYANYPQALAGFLARYGYISATQAQGASAVR